MAPRERPPVSTSGSLMQGVTTQKQRDVLFGSQAKEAYVPPASGTPPRAAPNVESTSAMDTLKGSTQADTLRRAAQDGTPFCEQCTKGTGT